MCLLRDGCAQGEARWCSFYADARNTADDGITVQMVGIALMLPTEIQGMA